MENTITTLIGIVLAVILMFIFPLMVIADRTDDVAQLVLETATAEFINETRSSGRLTHDSYNKFVQRISSTGSTYNIEMEIRVADPTPGKQTTIANPSIIGENVYYTKYTSQIMEELDENNGVMPLKEGDSISISIKNTNTTLSQQLKGFLYSVTGDNTYTLATESSGIITSNGSY